MIASAQSMIDIPAAAAAMTLQACHSLCGKRKDQKDQSQHEGQVNAAMHHFRQKAETCRIIMEDRQNYEQGPDNAGSQRRQRAKADFRVEFFFKLSCLGFI